MLTSYSKELKKVDTLIIHGEFKEAYKLINDSINKKDISKEDKFGFLAFKSELEFYFGNFDESIKLADKILKNGKIADSLVICDVYTWKAISSFLSGRTDDCKNALEKGYKTIFAVKNDSIKAVSKRKAQLLSWYALFHIHSGDFEKGLELAKKATPFAEKSGFKNIICLNLLALVDCHVKVGQREQIMGLSEKALALATELGNKFYQAFSHGIYTREYTNNIKDFRKMEEHYLKCLSIAEEMGTKFLYIYKNDIGDLYLSNFHFDKALKYYNEALEAAPLLEYMTTNAIGTTYLLKYDLDKALDCYLRSMNYCEAINDRYMLPGILHNLVTISIELNNLEQAKKYLTRLKELKEDTGFTRIEIRYRWASISILKASGSMTDLVQAKEQLNGFLANEELSRGSRLSILYNLLEIQLKELQLSANEETLREVRKGLHHLEVEAEENQFVTFLANIYRLHSQLSLIGLDVKQAITFLDKAQAIAEETGVESLKKQIKEDYEKINQQLSMLQQFQEQNTPISETIKLTSLTNTVQKIKQETVLEERDQETGEVIEYRKLFSIQL